MSQLTLRIEEAPWNLKLKVLRVLTGKTIEETAVEAGINSRTLWIWESEIQKTIPRKNNRKAISLVFEIPEEDIFGIVESDDIEEVSPCNQPQPIHQ